MCPAAAHFELEYCCSPVAAKASVKRHFASGRSKRKRTPIPGGRWSMFAWVVRRVTDSPGVHSSNPRGTTMNRRPLPSLASLSFALTLAAPLALHAQAPAPAPAPPDFSKVEIKTTKLADNFYMLEGQGGQIGILP